MNSVHLTFLLDHKKAHKKGSKGHWTLSGKFGYKMGDSFSRLWLAINAFVEIVQIPDERNGLVGWLGCTGLVGPYWAGWAVHYARAVPAPLPEDDDDAISIVELLAQ